MWYTIIAVLGVALVPWLANEWEDENREAMVAAREIVRFAARPMTVNVSLTRTTRRRRTPISSIPTTEKPKKATMKRMHRQPLSTIGPNHVCGRSFYTYCSVLNQEAYYSAREGRCLLTTADAVRVCNRSPQPLCQHRRVLQLLWSHVRTHGRPVLRENLVCGLQQARRLAQLDVGESRGCRRPKAKSCTEEQLRFPYFAEILASGRGHCVKATVENLLMHRCLIGANQFNSVSACQEACERRKT
ncbi:hypothetical protein MRX96_043456 [Rhipicephalus microplus]